LETKTNLRIILHEEGYGPFSKPPWVKGGPPHPTKNTKILLFHLANLSAQLPQATKIKVKNRWKNSKI